MLRNVVRMLCLCMLTVITHLKRPLLVLNNGKRVVFALGVANVQFAVPSGSAVRSRVL